MRRFGRFIILALIGFALGAAIAYFQGMQEAKKSAAIENPVVAEATEPTPEAAEDAISEAAENEAESISPAAEQQTSLPEEQQASPDAAAAPESQAQPVAGSTVGGAFALTDHNGNNVTEKSWPGKYKLVFFGFTNCPEICPVTLDKLTGVLNTLGGDAEKVQTLFVTTDPARDTAEAMKAYVGGYHPSILGLTGTEEQVKAAVDTYKVYAAKVPGADEGSYMMDHSSYVFLMSPDDQMLEIFRKDDAAADMAVKIKTHVAVQ